MPDQWLEEEQNLIAAESEIGPCFVSISVSFRRLSIEVPHRDLNPSLTPFSMIAPLLLELRTSSEANDVGITD